MLGNYKLIIDITPLAKKEFLLQQNIFEKLIFEHSNLLSFECNISNESKNKCIQNLKSKNKAFAAKNIDVLELQELSSLGDDYLYLSFSHDTLLHTNLDFINCKKAILLSSSFDINHTNKIEYCFSK